MADQRPTPVVPEMSVALAVMMRRSPQPGIQKLANKMTSHLSPAYVERFQNGVIK